MKKILIILSLLFFAFASIAQVRTISTKTLSSNQGSKNYATYLFSGDDADTLTVNQDTIQISFLLNKDFPTNYYANIVLDTIAGADTTVVVNVYGKMFSSGTYALIETTTTSAISALASVAIESMVDPDYSMVVAAATDTFNADSTTTVASRSISVVPSIKPYYRYLMFELIISGDDSVGAGISLEELELFVVQAK